MKKLCIKIITTFIVFFVVTLKISVAQVIAGGIPIGTSIKNPGINLSVSAMASDTLVSLDIDCDATDDINIRLYKGAPSIDVPNDFDLFILNKSFEICADTGIGMRKITFYNQGDTLCTGAAQQWVTDTIYTVCWGGFDCFGPDSITDKYIAYKKVATQEIGWIKISFKISDPAPVSLSISEILVLCNINMVSQLSDNSNLKLIPNPLVSISTLRLPPQLNNAEAIIYNILGNEIMRKTFSGNEVQIEKGKMESGLYFVKVRAAEKEWVEKLMVE